MKDVLQSIIQNNPYELIIIDGKSEDSSVKIARKFTKNIFYDSSKGLGNARNCGLEKATGDYVFYVGPDNELPSDTIVNCFVI